MQHGVVKWFDPVKGYGFIAGDTGADIFVHQSDILMKGFRNLEVGQRVSYQIESTDKGNKAINVVVGVIEKGDKKWDKANTENS